MNQYSSPSSDLGSMVFRSLSTINQLRASTATGTAAAPQPTPARPPLAYTAPVPNDEALIAANHAAKRERLARRRAQQQLELARESAERLGISISTEAIVRIVVQTYNDVLSVARR